MYQTIERMIFPPDSNPYGFSYSDWTVRWWKWVLSIPKETNPISDITGVHSAQCQKDPNVCFWQGLSEVQCEGYAKFHWKSSLTTSH